MQCATKERGEGRKRQLWSQTANSMGVEHGCGSKFGFIVFRLESGLREKMRARKQI